MGVTHLDRTKLTHMHIGITFDLKSATPLDPTLSDDQQEEFDSPHTIEAIAKVLRDMGHEVTLLGDNREFLEKAIGAKLDLVFNFAEGTGVSRSREARVPAALELLGIPYTGSDPFTMAATLDKNCAKLIVAQAGVNVPRSFALEPDMAVADIPADRLVFPLVVKPAWEGSSKGIRNTCLVDRLEDLAGVVEPLRQTQRQTLLLEEYIRGDEITIGLYGNADPQVIGIMQVVPNKPNDRFVYTLEVKREYKEHVTYRCPPEWPESTTRAAEAAAKTAFRALGLPRCGPQLDFRVRDGVPYFLEVNPLPDSTPVTAISSSWPSSWDGAILNSSRRSSAPHSLASANEVAIAFLFDGHPMPKPLILTLYNQPLLPLGHPDAESEHSVVQIATKASSIVEQAGYRTALLPLGLDPTVLWKELKKRKPAAVLNFFEGNYDRTETESYVAGLMEWKGVSFTGSPMQALTVGRAKHLTKHLLRGAGLPTSEYRVVERLPVGDLGMPWPVIVKPATQDASVGMAQDSVCTNAFQLEQRVAYLLETFGPPVLIEEYVAGREFNVGVIELPDLQALPPAEILFNEPKEGYWPILTYEGKWIESSPDYQGPPPKYPAEIEPRLEERMCDIAKRAFRVLGCRDYARIDFRMNAAGEPYVLEINPNPEICDYACFGLILKSAGIRYEDFLIRLVEQAIARGKAGMVNTVAKTAARTATRVAEHPTA
ncbi:MAG: ATP-grasp domain-containing protein [Gemmataceae bacterium]